MTTAIGAESSSSSAASSDIDIIQPHPGSSLLLFGMDVSKGIHEVRSNHLLWSTIIVSVGSLAFLAGYQFVTYLRQSCRYTKRVKRLTTAIFLTPITVFVLLNVFVVFLGLDRTFADSISFGIVTGIIVKLSTKPTGEGSIKLVAQQTNDGKHVDVWLDSLEVTVGEVRNKIAEALGVSPANRIAIESGKGAYMEDYNKPFFPLIDESSKTTDFFGFVTMLCYINVKEEEKKRVTIADGDNEDEHNKTGDKRSNPFRAILKKPEIRFGDSLSFLAKIAAASDPKASFNISCIDKFAAAAPLSMQILNTSSVRLISWEALLSENGAVDAVSDAGGDGVSVSSGGTKQGKSPKFSFRKKKVDQTSKHGKPVCNGDTVVLECGGKYMSVTRGWWMGWSSTEPRRSGAFTIEIVEKAQNKLKEQLKEIKENFKEKIVRPGQVMIGNTTTSGGPSTTKDVDNVLRPGDLFRLRSVKFPEFELGLTSIKLRDEYCYLGLRKINGDDNNAQDESWCMEMLFTMRNPNDIFTKV